MILLKLPNNYDKSLLLIETKGYLRYNNIDINLAKKLLDLEFNIPSYEYYHVYVSNNLIGFTNGYSIEHYWVANRVYLTRPYYFKQLIDKLGTLKTQEEYSGIIINNPTKATAEVYDKHNIAKRI